MRTRLRQGKLQGKDKDKVIGETRAPRARGRGRKRYCLLYTVEGIFILLCVGKAKCFEEGEALTRGGAEGEVENILRYCDT